MLRCKKHTHRTRCRHNVRNMVKGALSKEIVQIPVPQILERIDEMVTLPTVEQGEDGKKAYDIDSFDQTEDEGKVLVQQIAGCKDAIRDNEYQLSTTHARIEAVLDESGVKETKIPHSD